MLATFAVSCWEPPHEPDTIPHMDDVSALVIVLFFLFVAKIAWPGFQIHFSLTAIFKWAQVQVDIVYCHHCISGTTSNITYDIFRNTLAENPTQTLVINIPTDLCFVNPIIIPTYPLIWQHQLTDVKHFVKLFTDKTENTGRLFSTTLRTSWPTA